MTLLSVFLRTHPIMLLLLPLISTVCVGLTQAASEVSLHWLAGGEPAVLPGTTWGVPWPEGAIAKGAEFSLRASSEATVPVQSWPLAYWPDGSVKWTAHAMSSEAGRVGTLSLVPGKPEAPERAVTVSESDSAISIDTGVIQCGIAKKGKTLIEAISRDGKKLFRDGRLVCLLQDWADPEKTGAVRSEAFSGEIASVVVEQRGPVRAVVKITGKHSNGKGRAWLPFVVRLYFYAGGESIRVMHTIIYDGDQEKDFIRGFELRFTVPMRGELYDRHVRFAGEDGGLWGETVRGITGLRRDPNQAVRDAQVGGVATPPLAEWNPKVADHLALIPAFGDFTLFQPTADSFEIRKRTKEGFTWLNSAYGKRAAGLGWIGSPQGGMAFGIRNFWQSHPTELDIKGVAGDAATVTLWLWSPEAKPMDMRFYHDEMGETTQPAAFGGPIWGLPDRSTPAKAKIEDQLDFYLDYYRKEVEKRHWYGFWNYGNVMHTYDEDRHVWRYDVGGFAWDNSELSTDLWLRYSFLRSGHPEVFRMAEAMTRQTGEIDIYHLGRFAGLGIRHGVVPWGDSAKQLRISTAANRRFLYYLTADERIGDLLHEEVGAVRRLVDVEPGRNLATGSTSPSNPHQTKPFPLTMSIGTDWGAVSAALLAEWERTGDPKCRDLLTNGMKSVAALPHGWFSGGGGFDVSHLSSVFGAFEVNAELLQLLDVPEFAATWLQYCQFYNAGAEEQKRVLGVDLGKLNLGQGHSRLTAYAAWKTDPKLASRAWAEFLSGEAGLKPLEKPYPIIRVQGPAVLNPIDETKLSTNAVAQWGLAAIECLGLVGNDIPKQSTK